jgi:hypothetical protein
VYLCQFCKHWHVGNTIIPKKKAVRVEDRIYSLED